MNRKKNPYVSLVALMLLALILVLICTGCVKASAATEPRFTKEYHHMGSHDYAYIITDTETGAKYLFFKGYDAGGLCKLEG